MADKDRTVRAPLEKLHENERIKADSDYLRGRIKESLAEPITGALLGQDHQITKFHGIYVQDDRDLRDERRRQKLEPAHQFMVRLRIPGGVVAPWQWLVLDDLARRYANATLRLTTRQTFQFHGIIKRHLKATMQGIDSALLDTIAACGDDNRNVMCHNKPEQSGLHAEVHAWAQRISRHLMPHSRAYHEIWLDEERVAGGPGEPEPIYGATYLPRKFKIAVAVPPSNDVDVFSNDLGFIAVSDDRGGLAGFNVTVGGGMAATAGEPRTYPRLGDLMGFCLPDQVVEVAEKVVTVQRDWGDRVDRKHARLKYTIDDHGLAAFRTEVEARLGYGLGEPRSFTFLDNGDHFGWQEGTDGLWYYTQFVENGRVRDGDSHALMTGLREIARVHEGDMRVTANQNLILGKVTESARTRIQAIVDEYGLSAINGGSPVRRASMACVAFPTCPLAMAESERYLPELVTKIEALMAEAGLSESSIIVRMSGCPNGCSRPYLGEIGFVGRGTGRYNLYLGAGFAGQRLNKLYRENIPEDLILDELAPIIRHFAADRGDDEPFGDFVVRAGYVQAVASGPEVHG
jgi:sulfite reductase (NADPH) hemoprotein beta-component